MSESVLCRCCGTPVALGAICEVDGTVAPVARPVEEKSWSEPVSEKAEIVEQEKTHAISAAYKAVKRTFKK